jgi:hypothetical protein
MMTIEQETPDEVIDPVEVDEEQEEVAEHPEAPEDDEGEELQVSFGDDEPQEGDDQQKAPDWVKKLRQDNRANAKRLKELEQENERLKGGGAPKLSAKPTLESHDYDSDAYETALETWYEQKRKVDAEEDGRRKADEEANKAFQSKLEAYGKAKNELLAGDFDEAEAEILGSLSQIQQSILVKGADNPAMLVYALGKNSARLAELAAIKDPVEFAFKAAKMETSMKVQKRSVPPPEKTISGGRVSSQSNKIDDLKSKAEKTGDYTAYLAAKRAKKD